MSSSKCSEPYNSAKNRWDKQKTTDYRRVSRHLDYFIHKALTSEDREIISESELQKLLHRETGFRIKKETLRKYLSRLEERYGEAPLEPSYRIYREFFERYPPKPPRHNRRK